LLTVNAPWGKIMVFVGFAAIYAFMTHVAPVKLEEVFFSFRKRSASMSTSTIAFIHLFQHSIAVPEKNIAPRGQPL
jgi:hypothetical protein